MPFSWKFEPSEKMFECMETTEIIFQLDIFSLKLSLWSGVLKIEMGQI